MQWYTGGSKTPEDNEAGIYCPRIKLSVPMCKYPSVFQAEIYAINRCAEINLLRGYHNERILILSDRQAALKALSSLECIKNFNTLAELNNIQLLWVPSYNDIRGNEIADGLSRTVAALPSIDPEQFLAIGPKTLSNLPKTNLE